MHIVSPRVIGTIVIVSRYCMFLLSRPVSSDVRPRNRCNTRVERIVDLICYRLSVHYRFVGFNNEREVSGLVCLFVERFKITSVFILRS